MLKQVIRLTRPGVFLPHFAYEAWPEAEVAVRPTWLSICAADQRYFRGDRPEAVLRAKLPMALLHEAVGRVLYDPTGALSAGDRVVLVPCAAAPGEAPCAVNYLEGGKFHSSNCDGFAQELLCLPHSQLVAIRAEDEKLFVFAELMSVCVHAVRRWLAVAGDTSGGTVGVWGDGSFSYILCLVLKALAPASRLVVFGKHDAKLAFFSFVDEVVNIASRRPFRVHHAFECVGGAGSEYAIRDIIERIRPQGHIFLLGVSEVDPPVHTRLVLEKGLCLTGCSRSSYADFLTAVELVEQPAIQGNVRKIVSREIPVRGSGDLEQAFKEDLSVPYKSVLRWMV